MIKNSIKHYQNDMESIIIDIIQIQIQLMYDSY